MDENLIPDIKREAVLRDLSGRIDVLLGSRLVEAYRREADRRGQRFDPFMRHLLLTIVRDDLFSAIIDDDK